MLVNNLPPAFSGAARQALQLAAHLKERGTEVFFLGGRILPGSPRRDVIQGFPAYRVPYRATGKWTKLRGLCGYMAVLWRERAGFDILHVHGPFYLILAVAWFAGKVLRKPVILKLTSLNFDTPERIKAGCYARISWHCYRQAAAFVCMTTAQLEQCRRHGLPESRLRHIPNGVNATRFRPAASEAERAEARARLQLDPAGEYVVVIGTLEIDKGMETVVAVAERVCARRPQAKFLIIGPDGTGPGETHVLPEFVASLRTRIQKAGLDKDVLLLGQRPNPEDYLRAASAFLSASRSEGFGTVLIEAMATGLPCVAFKIPGVTSDIIDDGVNGRLVGEEKAEAFSAGLLRYLEDPALARRAGEAAREKVLRLYDLRSLAERYDALYQQLCQGAERAGNPPPQQNGKEGA